MLHKVLRKLEEITLPENHLFYLNLYKVELH